MRRKPNDENYVVDLMTLSGAQTIYHYKDSRGCIGEQAPAICC
jgi:hypothetical protein